MKGPVKDLTANDMEDIVKLVAEHYGIYLPAVYSQLRRRKHVVARQVAIFIMDEILDKSYTAIGKHLKRDHATVIHALKAIKNDIATDDLYRYEVLGLLEKARKLEFKEKYCKQQQFKISKNGHI